MVILLKYYELLKIEGRGDGIWGRDALKRMVMHRLAAMRQSQNPCFAVNLMKMDDEDFVTENFIPAGNLK